VWSPLAILRPDPTTLNSRFLYFALQATDLQDQLQTSSTVNTQQNIAMSDIGALRLTVPPLASQRNIAGYLDRETRRIDALVTAKRRMLERLAERFQALLELSLLGDHLSETGSAWHPRLGRGRSLWRIKHLAKKIGSGKTPAGGGESYVDDGVRFLRSQNVLMGRLSLADVAHIPASTDEEMGATRVLPGDVLLNITGASLGRCCVAPTDIGPANVNQHVCIVRPRPDCVGQLLHYAIRARSVQEQIRQEQVGGNRDGLNFEQVGNLEVALPSSAPAQAALAAQLTHAGDTHQRVAGTLEDQISLLAERRQSLITAAVTGQLDISEAP